MRRQRPRSTRTDTPSPDTTLFRSRHTNGARRLFLKRYAHTPCCSVRKDTTCPSHQFYVAHRKPCNENVPLALPSITFGHKPFGRRRRGGGRPLWPSGRADESRGGKGCVSTCRSRGAPCP